MCLIPSFFFFFSSPPLPFAYPSRFFDSSCFLSFFAFLYCLKGERHIAQLQISGLLARFCGYYLFFFFLYVCVCVCVCLLVFSFSHECCYLH